MIGIDTNVLVRYLTQDDRSQSAKATKLIDSLSSSSPGFVTTVSIVELVWVLTACYKASPKTIADTLETLLQTEEMIIERAELVGQALRQFQASPHVDFADCLIVRSAHAADCEFIMTFDKSAAKSVGMRLIT